MKGSPVYLSSIYFTEVAIAFLLQVIGLYLLLTVKPKKPMDLLLVHLILIEVLLEILYVREWHDLPPLLKNWADRVIAWAVYYQTLSLIMIDRVLAVKLTLHYQLKVTKRKIIVALLTIWLIGILHGIAAWLNANTRIIVYHGWSCIVIIIFTVGYIFILTTVNKSRRLLPCANAARAQRRLKYRVPFFIILSFIAFNVVPMLAYYVLKKNLDLFIAIGVVNFIADQLIYTLGTWRLRERIKNLLYKGCINIGTSQENSDIRESSF